jgi:CDP-glycerol glycerophosphotransferase (TagB/SpsB family)
MKLVFLHHGVLGFKKFNDYYLNDKNRMDIFTVGSEAERRILIETIGVNSDIVKVTGYARYDFLRNELPRHRRQIVYMPTYRDWVGDDFNSSQFAARIYGFLNNKRLHELLELKNVDLQFYMHYRMQSQIDIASINSARVRFTKAGVQSPSEIIAQSRMLITDYSSVAWDFRFLEKPVAFYRFDKDRYDSERGSYLPLDEDIIGCVFYDEDSLINEIENTIGSNFECRPTSRSVDDYFPAMDGNSCQRICEAISQLV